MTEVTLTGSSERVEGPLDAFVELRDRLIRERAGNGGTDVCELVTGELDQALVAIAEPMESGMALVAVGGYGRRELSLHSDVDLMLLHGGEPASDAVRTVFYPLWDAGLRVGHSVRSVKEAIDAARDSIETLTSLLTARLVWGEEVLLRELDTRLAELCRKERAGIEATIVSGEIDRRSKEPYPLLAADLKVGRGGLRVFHAVDWMRRLAAYADESGPDLDPAQEAAHDDLLSVRNALHAAGGRQFDQFAPELRVTAAEWLDDDVGEVARLLQAALRKGDLLSQRRFVDRKRAEPVLATARWLVGAVRSRSNRQELDEAGFALARAAKIATGSGPPLLSPLDEQRIGASPAPVWSEDDRRALVRLIGGGTRGRELFDQLVELGWVDRAIPEWSHVIAAPQFDPVHVHTVDGHLWRTVDELIAVAGPESPERWCREFADDIGSLDELLIAAFFHDIGKGLDGDHSEVGAELVGSFAGRIGVTSRASARMERLVRNHLLLPKVAGRRDTDDPAVIAEMADVIGDKHALRSLALLTVADARATGPSMWNEWKSALVGGLVFKVLDELEGRGNGSSAWLESDAVAEVAEEIGDGFSEADVERHAAGMPEGYVRRFTTQEIVRHLKVSNPPPDEGRAKFDVEHRYPVSSLVLATRDRPGLLVDVAGVLALHNVSILDARLATRDDGVAIDTFHVGDALRTGGIGKSRWPDIRRDLNATLAGRLDLEELLADKARSYPSPASGPGEVRVFDVAGSTVAEVRCADRIGLLHDLAAAIRGAGFDVTLAKVDTRDDRVIDVFYVRTTDADTGGRVDELRVALEAVVNADAEDHQN